MTGVERKREGRRNNLRLDSNLGPRGALEPVCGKHTWPYRCATARPLQLEALAAFPLLEPVGLSSVSNVYSLFYVFWCCGAVIN